MDTYTIDASHKKLGRIASEAARALMGKHRASYTPNAMPSTTVLITGAGALDISEKKSMEKKYKRYSGYPGGQKELSLAKVAADKGMGETLRIAIRGMLPRNMLRAKRMKLLKIED